MVDDWPCKAHDFQPGKCQKRGLSKQHTWPVSVPLLRAVMHDSDSGIGIDSGISHISAGIGIGIGISPGIGIGIRNLQNAGIEIGIGIKTYPESCITD